MKTGLLLLILVLVAVGAIGFQTGAYYEFRRLFATNPAITNPTGDNPRLIETNTIFNYGNGTSIWFNETKPVKGQNFYNLTLILTDGNIVSQAFASLSNEHQVLSINGVGQTQTEYWSLWKFCASNNAWAWSPVGADEIMLSNNGIYGWYYQNYNTQDPPVHGAASVLVLDITSC